MVEGSWPTPALPGLARARAPGLNRTMLPRVLSWIGVGIVVWLWMGLGRRSDARRAAMPQRPAASAPPLRPLSTLSPLAPLRSLVGWLLSDMGVVALVGVAMLGVIWLITQPIQVPEAPPLAQQRPLIALPALIVRQPLAPPAVAQRPRPRSAPITGVRSPGRADPAVMPRERSQRGDPPLPAALAKPVPRLPFLPEQVETIESATLWSGPEAGARSLGSVEAGQVLRVQAAQRNRLQVEHLSGSAWISLLVVEPVANQDLWVQPSGEQQVWTSALSPHVVTVLPTTSLLRVLREDRAHGRAQVRAYYEHGEFLAEGWVDLAALRAAPTPGWAAKLSGAAPRVNLAKLSGSRQAFIERVGSAAREASKSTHIPASVTVAQAILESSWGESRLAREASNYFGIKAHSAIGPAGVIWMPTTEVLDGQEVRVVDVFRAYHDLSESIWDKHKFLAGQPRYREAMQATGSPGEFVRRMWQAGYSTDPDYVDKVLSLIRQYDLTRFDPR